MNVTGITSSCVSFLEIPQPAPPVVPLTIEVYVIASGGGGGGTPSGQVGGGGGGGLIYNAALPIQQNTLYSIVVGAAVGYRTQGNNSSAFGLTALGGGYGAGPNAADLPSSGGSGGGGSWSSGSSRIGASGTQPTSASGGYGNKGGNGYAGVNGAGGGGCGAAGGADSNPAAAPREYGGTGFLVYVNNVYNIVCGGGGATQTTGGAGSGSSNYGGGGNGGSTSSTGGGGPGVVMFLYPDTFGPATVTGSPSILVYGGIRSYTFFNSGSVLIP